MSKTAISTDKKALIKRYLIWCFKTTKEDLERIDRKFTQLDVDSFLLQQLRNQRPKQEPLESKFCDEFKLYMDNKKTDAENQKFEDKARGRLQPHYVYLKRRLEAIEAAIIAFLGKSDLPAIQKLYEVEMTRRILEAREHK